MAWTLRAAEGGEVYEDLSFEQVVEWAHSAHIHPQDELSENGVEWRTASEISELEMHWLATLVDSREYGPTNVSTLIEFLDAGLVAMDSPCRHRDNKQRFFLRELLQGEIPAQAQLAPPPPLHKDTQKAGRLREGSPQQTEAASALAGVISQIDRPESLRPAPTLEPRSDPYPVPPLPLVPIPEGAYLPSRAS